MSDAILGVIVGGLLGAIPSVITFWIGKRSEEKRHLRELAFHAGVENWKEVRDAASKFGASIQPLDLFILHMLKLSEAVTRRGLTSENVAERLREVHQITSIARDEIERYTNRKKAQPADPPNERPASPA